MPCLPAVARFMASPRRWKRQMTSGIGRPRSPRLSAAAFVAICTTAHVLTPQQVSPDAIAAGRAQTVDEATVAIDASKVENRISPRLYGHFAEFMFENIKFGLHAELLRNRGFEEPASAIGLPRHWERDPDDRNDDAMRFRWDDSVAYPPSRPPGQHQVEHSLRLDLPVQDGQRRGFSQAGCRSRRDRVPRVSLAPHVGFCRPADRRARAGSHGRGDVRDRRPRRHRGGR